MKVIKTALDGVYIIEPRCFEDNRGWFSETYNQEKLQAEGIHANFIQDNHSFSKEVHTLRGLHAQKAPYAQAKLVRCTRGKIVDIAVDFRKDSPNYLKWIKVELSADNKRQLFIPHGFLHGFLTLEENSEVQYKVDNVYNKDSEITIKYDDEAINISWEIASVILSEKDRNGLTVKQFEEQE